ncbi:MAG: sugar ABC transporter ATP-binding protein [Azospirillaceae bacterium]
MTAPPIVELKGITKRFPGVLALDDVGLSIEAGSVHAVVGENGAGKSTLMNILAGELQPDRGEILLDGEEITIPSPMASQRIGVKVVYQELSLCANLSVAENIMLDRLAARPAYGLFRRREIRQAARASLKRLGMEHLDPSTPVADLSVAQKQLVEIARAISQKARILVLDEPNSALAKSETARLFRVIEQLNAEGVTIVYVSHHLEEVLHIADRISVMRDGRHIETVENNAGVTPAHLIASMVGRALELSTRAHAQPIAANQDRPAVLAVERLSAAPVLRDVGFQLRAGEILGVAGLPDSGKDDLPAAVFGLIPRGGSVTVVGQSVPPLAPRRSIRAGMALVPADRRGAGALLSMSVQENVVASSLDKVSRLGFVDGRKVRALGRSYVRQLDARIAHLRQKIRTLSGGNQQKIIIARGLATRPRVLILHEPTRGIDVGAKAEIYGILAGLAEQGVGILLISSEMPELISQCHRVLIMHEGRVRGEVTGDDITEETILSAAMGQ